MFMKNRGFTLIEMMVTLVVLTILLSIGLPSFQGAIRDNRVTTKTNELIAAINLARSEAIRRGEQVDVSPNAGDWNQGWTVQLTDGTVLRSFDAPSGTITVAGNAGILSYSATGLPTDYTTRVDTLVTRTFNVCDSGEYGRQIRMVTGRPSIENRNPC